MSAFVVDREHIDALVAAGLEGRSRNIDLRWYWPDFDHAHQLDYLNADEVGQMLWNENVRSVAHRYPGDEPDSRPGPNDFTDAEAEAYTYTDRPGAIILLTPPVVLKAIHCFEYQSCEHPEWEHSEAHAYCRALEAAYIRRIAGYEAAPWGIDRGFFDTVRNVRRVM